MHRRFPFVAYHFLIDGARCSLTTIYGKKDSTDLLAEHPIRRCRPYLCRIVNAGNENGSPQWRLPFGLRITDRKC